MSEQIKVWRVTRKSFHGWYRTTRYSNVQEEIDIDAFEGNTDDLIVEEEYMTQAEWDQFEETAPEWDGW
jgi:hypothetical protein